MTDTGLLIELCRQNRQVSYLHRWKQQMLIRRAIELVQRSHEAVEKAKRLRSQMANGGARR
jgi:hypothetical protein